jgi:hypothetical protein
MASLNRRLPALTSLLLENSAVTDAQLDRLAALTGLIELDLTGTLVSRKTVARLQAALPRATIYAFDDD